MTKLTGAQALVRSLDREGIEMVFGIPGNHSMPIFDALYHHPRIRTMTVRHEQAAAFMADGYARASGRIAAVLTLPGPGLTNTLTALGEAFTDSSPVLLLATQVNRPFIDQDRGLLHELTGQFEVAAAFTKQSERVRAADEIPGSIRRALAALRSGRPRPVQVEIPRDVQLETMDWSDEEDALQAVLRVRACATEEAIAAAALALHQAERPLIIAGGGVISSEASDLLVRLAERLGAPGAHHGQRGRRSPRRSPPGLWRRLGASGRHPAAGGRRRRASGCRHTLQRSHDPRLEPPAAAYHDPH